MLSFRLVKQAIYQDFSHSIRWVVYTGDRFLALSIDTSNGNGKVLYSIDGTKDWRSSAFTTTTPPLISMASTTETSVAISENAIYTFPSSNLSQTSIEPMETGNDDLWTSVAYDSFGKFVAVSKPGTRLARMLQSTNGSGPWTSVVLPDAIKTVGFLSIAAASLVSNNNTYIAVLMDNSVKISEYNGGTAWTLISTFGNVTTQPPTGISPGSIWSSVTYTGEEGGFVLLSSSDSAFAMSYDGTEWLYYKPEGDSYSWKSVSYDAAKKVYVVVASNNKIASIEVLFLPSGSFDRIIFNIIRNPSSTATGWSSIAFGNDIFVGVSGVPGGTIMTSKVSSATKPKPATGAAASRAGLGNTRGNLIPNHPKTGRRARLTTGGSSLRKP